MVRRGTVPRRKPHPQKPRVGHPAQGKPALQSMVRICQTKGYGTARNSAEEKTPPSKTEGGAPSSGETCPTEHGENLPDEGLWYGEEQCRGENPTLKNRGWGTQLRGNLPYRAW